MQKNLNLTHGLIHSQQVLLLLTEKGLTREISYKIVQRNAMRCWETGEDLKALLLADKDVAARSPRRNWTRRSTSAAISRM